MSEHRAATSILAAIEARGNEAPRVRLRELPDDPAPALEKITLRATGRFEVLGKIAQGGVGDVVKGRDVDLGRDVAMKILRKDHMDNAELLKRFVEEAQIGGQLQHPGIVPIYELGLGDDERPYFAMRLIKGRTLAAFLSDGADPRRALQVFVQVCQTMAYAHSRGVIHRDLKPSNVMIGAFGEVQVVDWGFAKVLLEGGVADERRAKQAMTDMTRIATVRSSGEGSQSIPGSVMGTPAYMPPEQALGYVDDLDERSDVFSLGAILCEILTGRPPYVADDGKDLLVLAAQGKTDDAQERLDGCGAEPRLVTLAKSCLSALRQDRPRNAGVLAEAVGSHLAEAEERAQRSQLAALEARKKAAAASAQTAEERTKAEAAHIESEKARARAERAREKAERARAEADDARKRRRQTLALAAAVLLAVLVGGGSWLWIEGDRRARVREARVKVDEALEDAGRLKGEGKWVEALAAAQRAVDVAEADSRPAAEAALEEVREAKNAADELAARRQRDAEFVAKLDEERAHYGDDFSYGVGDARYAELFAEFGLDLRDPEAAGRKIVATTRAAEIAAALDSWANWVRNLPAGSRRDWKALVRAARAADPDPQRNRLRDALLKAAKDRFPAIVAELEEKEQSTQTLVLAARLLADTGDAEAAIAFLRRMQRNHPGDTWINFELGDRLAAQQRWLASVRYFDAALVEQPRSATIRTVLGRALMRSGSHDRAIEVLEDALAINPNASIARVQLAATYLDRGDRKKAFEIYAEACRRAPESGHARANFGVALERLGHVDDSIAAYRDAIEVEPDLVRAYRNLGGVLKDNGRADEAVELLAKALPLGPKNVNVLFNLAASYGELARLDDSIRVWHQIIDVQPLNYSAHLNIGIIHRKKAELDDAEKWLEKAKRLNPEVPSAHIQLGLVERDRANFTKARAHADRALARNPTANVYFHLASILHYGGRMHRALVAIDEAVRLGPATSGNLNNRGVVLAFLGDWEGAIAAYRRALEVGPETALPHTNIGDELLKQGDVAGAREAYRRALELRPGFPFTLNSLGELEKMLGNHEEAAASFRRSLAFREVASVGYWQFEEDQAFARCRLAFELLHLGRFQESLDEMRKGHAAGSKSPLWAHSSGQWVEDCERYVELEGQEASEDPEEQVALATMAYYGKRYDDAVRLFESAFAGDDSLVEESRHRLAAAGAAARLGERGKALAWLRAELRDRDEALSGSIWSTRVAARTALLRLMINGDFMALRGETALKKIPEPERGEWRAFWIELRRALAKRR